jgi:hypothetical protein
LYKDEDPFIEGALKRVRLLDSLMYGIIKMTLGRLALNQGYFVKWSRLDY